MPVLDKFLAFFRGKPIPGTFGTLPLQKGNFHSASYAGSRTLTWAELKEAQKEICAPGAPLDGLRYNGIGLTNVAGAPVAEGARNCNALYIIFDSKADEKAFLKRPIPPAFKDVSFSWRISKPARLG